MNINDIKIFVVGLGYAVLPLARLFSTKFPGGRFDAVILAVAHEQFLGLDVRKLVRTPGVVYGVKGVLPRDVVDAHL